MKGPVSELFLDLNYLHPPKTACLAFCLLPPYLLDLPHVWKETKKKKKKRRRNQHQAWRDGAISLSVHYVHTQMQKMTSEASWTSWRHVMLQEDVPSFILFHTSVSSKYFPQCLSSSDFFSLCGNRSRGKWPAHINHRSFMHQ